MNNLKEYLKNNLIRFEELSESTVRIGNQTYELIFPNSEGKLFDDSFEMTCDDTVEDNYIFNFGGNYYWTPKGTETNPQLFPLRYIGEQEKQVLTDNFLGIHGSYEVLNGSRLYSDWINKATFLGCKCLGICEKNTLAGVLKFQSECKKNKLKSVLGATYTVFRKKEDFRYDVKLYVKDQLGWDNILKVNKEVNVINNKFITEDRLLELLEGLFVVIDPKSLDYNKLNPSIKPKIDYYQLDTVEYVNNERDQKYLINLKEFVNSNLKPISITDAFYLDKDQNEIKKVLNSISGIREYESDNQYFKSKDEYFNELEKLFNIEDDSVYDIFEDALKNEQYLVDNCNYQIDTGKKYLPKYIMTSEEKQKYGDNINMFWSLIEEGLNKKVKKENQQRYRNQIQKEYEIIEYGNLQDYFLINWEQIEWCKKNNIMTGLSRGSAAGFQTSNILGITQIDPFDYDLIAERFLTKERAKHRIADIDIDHEQKRRDEVKQHLIDKYGFDQCCSVGTYSTFQIKGGLKDIAKIKNVSFAEVNQISSILENECKEWNDIFRLSSQKPRLKAFVKENTDVINLLNLILNSKKSTSIHASAFIITPSDKTIYEQIPVRLENKDGVNILVSEWEGTDLEEFGSLKQDVLGLLQIDKFHRIIDLIKENKGIDIDIYNIPLNDKKTYSYFGKKWNSDVFQFGTKGLSDYCISLNPQNINDLIAAVALYRPGAMENNFHNEYVLRKNGEREVEYYSGTEEITKNTYGLLVYQESVMQICQKLAGFDLSETDDIRKALGKKKAEILEPYKQRFIQGSIKNGYDEFEMIDLWNAMEKFSGYSFNLSHAAAYGITGYISQWLKANYPIEFWIIAFDLGDDKYFSDYISEIYRSGDIKIATPEINKSSSEFTVDYDTNTIYWSITSVKQAGEISQQQIEEDKKLNGHYFSFEEFLSRHVRKGSKVTKQIIENLVLSGVFDEIEEIKQSKDRIKLINFYRKEYKVKIDKEKDQFTTNEDSVDTNWWWSLQQKKICGFSLFEFDLLCETYLAESAPYYDAISIDEEKEKKEVTTGGYLNELVVRNGKKGEYAELTLDNNFEFVTVKIWQDEWKKVKPMVDGKEKILILLSGTVDHDNWKKKNVLYTNKDSSICVLE